MTLEPNGEPVVYFTFPGLAGLGLPHATTSRHCPGIGPWNAGGPPFEAEASRALGPTGLDLDRIAWAHQVHGAGVAEVGTRGLVGAADVLVTVAGGVPLAIFTADCLAVTLCDPEGSVLAVAHVGWRGTVAGAAQAAVGALADRGGRPERVHAAVSPSIGPCCYEVDEPVIAGVARAYPGAWERWVRPARAGHWMLDLWTANEDLLEHAGVRRERIENPRACTACHPEWFYSYRKGHRGRLATVAALPRGSARIAS